jgi:hypothetical protein
MNGLDYLRVGLTLDRMGLAGVDPGRIVAHALGGGFR